MNTLVIDVGGTNVKVWRTNETEKIKVPSGKEMTPQKMVDAVREALQGWQYERVSIGYPGDIHNGHPAAEPHNLADGWVNFDYAKAFDAPVKIMNDACMQALGSYEGGRMLFLGLGTGIGTVFIIDGKIVPLALGHLKFCEHTFDEYLSRKALELHGEKRWKRAVNEATTVLKQAFIADYVVLGGGNTKKLDDLPEGCRRGANLMAYTGGVRMWEPLENMPALAVFEETVGKTG
ncbi:MAG: ROK family protein [Planctomycetota bacterium]|nr:ROK family protein [Planctomycetota bacterium]